MRELTDLGGRAGFLVSPDSDQSVWMQAQADKCVRLGRTLAEHGFVVQEAEAGEVCLDELPTAVETAGLDGFVRWWVDPAGGAWQAAVNEITLRRVFDDDDVAEPRDALVLRAEQMERNERCLPIVAAEERTEWQNCSILDSVDRRHGTKRRIQVPIVRRDPGKPSDKEADLLFGALKTELGQAAADRHSEFLLDIYIAEEKLYSSIGCALGIPGFATEDDEGEAGDELEVDAASLRLLSILQDRICGAFGWSGCPLPLMHVETEEFEAETWLEEVTRRRFGYVGEREILTEDAAVLWSRDSSERRAVYFRWMADVGIGGRVNGGEGPESASVENEAAMEPAYPTFFGWSRSSAVTVARLAVEYGEIRDAIVRRLGVDLCSMLVDSEVDGEREWERRVSELVARRNEAIGEVTRIHEQMIERAPGSEMWGVRLAMRTNAGHYTRFFLPGLEARVRETAAGGERRAPADKGASDWVFVKEVEKIEPGPSVIALAQRVLERTLDRWGLDAWKTLLDGMSKEMDDERAQRETEENREEVEAWAELASSDKASPHYLSINKMATTCFYEFAERPVSDVLYFGCEPYWEKVRAGGGKTVEFGPHLNNENQTIFIYQPNLRGTDLVAKALKALFFEAVLDDRARRGRDHGRPLVAYVADEFHRFITVDSTHGEQSFLDTCRSFGAFCVLACQSVSSMRYALHDLEPNSEKVKAAISILLSNTGTKLFFRTTDIETGDWVASLASTGPDLTNVVRVRPLSTLRPGECYGVLVDGRFRRAQLEQWPDEEKGMKKRAGAKRGGRVRQGHSVGRTDSQRDG